MNIVFTAPTWIATPCGLAMTMKGWQRRPHPQNRHRERSEAIQSRRPSGAGRDRHGATCLGQAHQARFSLSRDQSALPERAIRPISSAMKSDRIRIRIGAPWPKACRAWNGSDGKGLSGSTTTRSPRRRSSSTMQRVR
jgi:hypothetical protein